MDRVLRDEKDQQEVAKIMVHDPIAMQNWIRVSQELGLNVEFETRHYPQLVMGLIKYDILFQKMLQEWAARFRREATVGELCKVLSQLGLKMISSNDFEPLTDGPPDKSSQAITAVERINMDGDMAPGTKKSKIEEGIIFLPCPKPDKNFTGRCQLIEDVIKSLSEFGKNPSNQVGFPLADLHGLGGHGKTQTAQRIADKCAKENIFNGVIWIDAEHESGIIEKIRRELINQGIQDLQENLGLLLANKL
ncbi:hypothetical protein Fcan01_22923 [Folsomia candida]|uniref:Uncharacterized protein n=1 Tax=Folsomia candida TaxID=158441 RepID=A0A226DAX0_FOLCA|nr:hypothetical protein Fcan01_22923 [Folsomia candida]